MDKQSPFLELSTIWKDDDMFELRVMAANNSFSGTTEVYYTVRALLAFAEQLSGFPEGDQTLFYETGYKEVSGYFSMKFYCLDNAGHVAVQITLKANRALYLSKETDSLVLEIQVEPAAIDRFQKELYALAVKQEGRAILRG